MDDLLRALHRRWLADPGDTDAAYAFMAAYTRLHGESRGSNPLDEILLDLLCAHLDDNGVDGFTNNATVKLIRLMFGEDHVRTYLQYVEGQENRWYFDTDLLDGINDLDRVITSMPLRCGHSLECDRNDVKCEVKGCLCPGCFDPLLTISTQVFIPPTEIGGHIRSGHMRSLQRRKRRNLCYHHHELALDNIDRFMNNFNLL